MSGITARLASAKVKKAVVISEYITRMSDRLAYIQ